MNGPNWKNRALFHGDNPRFLRAMNTESVDLIATDPPYKNLWIEAGKGRFTDKPPEHTDDGEAAAPFLRVRQRVAEPDGPRWTRAQMYEHLLDQHGPRCMGCDRVFDDSRYLELGHNTPRSDGGLNHISNRILLCGPCNRAKSNMYTLSGLRRLNKKHRWMARQGAPR